MARTNEEAGAEVEEDNEPMPSTLPCPTPLVRIAPMLRTVTEYRFVQLPQSEEG